MKVCLSWLHEFLPVTPTAKETADALISVGVEVADVRYLAEGFDKIVLAKIEEAKKHPDADRLTLCRVTDGAGTHDIVCGASNFKVGDCVALAHVGAKLPNGLTIKASKIRGVASAGMLCSESELKMSEESEGIMVFPSDAPIGKPLADHLGRNDWLLTLELTPNRGDCLSVTGVAREVAAALKVSPKVPNGFAQGPSDAKVQAVVNDSKGSPRYVLRLLEDVTVGESPAWMKQRLEACGIRSINNLVDVTNYVLLERGQPLHAFDQIKVVGGIEVRRAKKGEKILCLDEIERTLDATDLVIADEKGPVAIAGVMGGLRTAVSDQTNAILLESAHFDPKSVRLTAKRLALHTEASHRFERWVDPQSVWDASDRAVELYAEVAGARAVAAADLFPQKITPTKLRVRDQEITRILGVELKNAGEYLSRIGLPVEKGEQGWVVEIPTRRSDLTREIDLVEEVARIYGYDQIPSSLTPIHAAPAPNQNYESLDAIRDFCRGGGFHEVSTYSFASEGELADFAAPSLGEEVLLKNPLVAEMTRMRQSLIPALLRIWKTNQFRQQKGIRLFEVGRVYGKGDEQNKTPLKEERHLAVLFGGESVSGNWNQKPRSATFYDAKGFLDSLGNTLGIGGMSLATQEMPSYFHPGQSATIVWRNRPIGTVGKIHPKMARLFEVKDVILLELQVEPLLSSMLKTATFKPFSPFPSVSRDLALVVPTSVAWGEIEKTVTKGKDPILRDLELFDIYEGKGIPEGSRSLAFSLTFGANDRTLTDKEVDASIAKIVKKLETAHQAKLRA